jgi:predicted RNase H-like nuclease (RuvC/YqgF family)
MPESAPPDPAEIERELSALEAGVGRLIQEISDLRQRASTAEQQHERLTGLLSKSGVELSDPESLQHRLEELTEENSRLKEILREARVRADRIRGRLIVMEDESAG